MMDLMFHISNTDWSPATGLQLAACSTRVTGTANPFGETSDALVTSRRRPDLV